MTIKDLARETGYSVGTISRVLNDQPNVSEKARKCILESVAKSGFSLNPNAKKLKQQHGNGILAVVTGKSNELFARMIEELQHLLADMRYPLTVDYVEENRDAVLHAQRRAAEIKPLGIFFLGGDTRFFEKSFSGIKLPCALLTVDASSLQFENLSSVTTDDVAAAESALEYLVSCGHRHIGIITGNLECSGPSRLRFEGCRRTFARYGMKLDEKACQTSRYSFSEGYDAMSRLLEQKELTAVFAMSDVMAIGAMRAIRDHGLRCPQDISVLGFDGLEMGDYYIPKLTTVRQNVERLAKRGVEILLGSIERHTPACHETISYELICKDSVCRI